MKLTQSTLRKIIREELEAVVREDATQPRFNALQNAQADILNALGKKLTDLPPRAREALSNLAARVVDGMSVEAARDELDKLAKPTNEAFDTENATLFNLVVKAGIPMTSADRKEFFADYLRRNKYTTAAAINNNTHRIAGELKRNRARQKAKN